MAGRRFERMANLSATLPIPMLDEIDELIHQGRIPSRSQVIRDAVRDYLKVFE